MVHPATPSAEPGHADGVVTDLLDWRARLADSLLLFDMRQHSPRFHGFVRGVPLGDVAFTSLWSDAHTASSNGMRAPDSEACHLLTFQVTGSKFITQNGRTARIDPGHFSVYDTAQPVTIESTDDAASLSLRIPQRYFDADPDAVRELSAIPLDADAGLAPVVAGMLVKLDRFADGVRLSTRVLTGHHLAGLASAMLRELLEQRGLSWDATSSASLRHRVYRYIQQNLWDADLSIGGIAAAHFISVRTLHKLFAQEERTVARWVRAQRLEGAQRELADPRQANVPIAMIASRWGFADPSYFGQVFKNATGRTPSEFRRLVDQDLTA